MVLRFFNAVKILSTYKCIMRRKEKWEIRNLVLANAY